MQGAPWKRLLQESLRRNEKLRHSKYIQIATVRPDGRPANRSVVYRGFFNATDDLTFVTDSRSNKIQELAHMPWAEIAWYFPETREQYRILGKVTVVMHDCQDAILLKARQAAWKQMSDFGRSQFLYPSPGIPRPPGEDGLAGFDPPKPTQNDPVVDVFCLCILSVDEVDHLQLAKNQRHTYKKHIDNENRVDWLTEYVNP